MPDGTWKDSAKPRQTCGSTVTNDLKEMELGKTWWQQTTIDSDGISVWINATQIQDELEEASTHKSAKTHAGNINGFQGLVVEHLLVVC